MPRDNSIEDEYGQDSFLDVVANVVGVLVILVMLVGIRASQALTSPAPTEEKQVAEVQEVIAEPRPLVTVQERSEAELKAELEQASRELHFQDQGLRSTYARLVSFSRQSGLQEQHRQELAQLRADMEQKIEERRNALSQESQLQYDVQNQIFQAKLELDDLSDQQLTLIASPGEVEEIEIEPTPVAKRVEEDAIHLRLLGGAVCRVPFHELMDELEYEMESIRRELSNSGQVNRVVGPVDGFRLRFRTKKVSSNQAVTGPQVGRLSEKDRFIPYYYFLSESDDLGEHLDQGLLSDSQLRRTLREARRKTSVVVLWVYEDSFDDYRAMRKLLTELDFTIAVYNLPMGKSIAASPYGRKAWSQ